MLAFNVSWGPELTSLRRWCPEIDTLFPCRNSWVAKGRRENVPMKISLNISIAVDYTSTKVYAVIGWPCIQDSFRWGTLMTLMILSFGVTGKFEIVETMFKNILVTQWDQQCKKKKSMGGICQMQKYHMYKFNLQTQIHRLSSDWCTVPPSGHVTKPQLNRRSNMSLWSSENALLGLFILLKANLNRFKVLNIFFSVWCSLDCLIAW